MAIMIIEKLFKNGLEMNLKIDYINLKNFEIYLESHPLLNMQKDMNAGLKVTEQKYKKLSYWRYGVLALCSLPYMVGFFTDLELLFNGFIIVLVAVFFNGWWEIESQRIKNYYKKQQGISKIETRNSHAIHFIHVVVNVKKVVILFIIY